MRIPQLIRIKHIIDLLNDCEYHKNQEIIDYLDDKLVTHCVQQYIKPREPVVEVMNGTMCEIVKSKI